MSSDQVIKPSMVVFAFDSLVNRLNGRPSPPIPADFPSQPFPLFVTWKTSSNGYLRGCIGCFADLELGSGIEEYALTAALKDSRFPPVQMNEVPGLSCTVSLLTNFEECSNSYDWTLENHGIKIRFNAKGRQFSGTYLPHVATEQGWNQEETLISLIRKAGFKGQITADFINSLSVTRYQSQTCSFSYEQYLQAKQ